MILLIDDDRGGMEIRATLLRTLGYEVMVAASYREAMPLLTPDVELAILDWHLPDIQGFALLSAVREAIPKAAIAVLSGSMHLPVGLEVDAVLIKGSGVDEMIETVGRLHAGVK